MAHAVTEKSNATIFWKGDNKLGERPIYNAAEDALYWIDCMGPKLFRKSIKGGEVKEWTLPKRIGTYAFCEGGGMIMALSDGVYRFNPNTGVSSLLAATGLDPKFVLNDGRCDPRGRFYVGTVNHNKLKGDVEAAYLYRLEGNKLVPVIPNIVTANGLAFSPDGRTMYNGCGYASTIWAHDYDLDTGAVSNTRVFAKIDEPLAHLDGAVVDNDGGYWLSIFGGGKVIRFFPNGEVDRVVQLPVSRPTMMAFGGTDYSTAYVVTAGANVDARMPEPEPDNGSVFSFDPEQKGSPEPLARL